MSNEPYKAIIFRDGTIAPIQETGRERCVVYRGKIFNHYRRSKNIFFRSEDGSSICINAPPQALDDEDAIFIGKYSSGGDVQTVIYDSGCQKGPSAPDDNFCWFFFFLVSFVMIFIERTFYS